MNRQLIAFIARENGPVLTGLGLVLGLVVCESLRSLTIHLFWQNSQRYSVGLRTIVYTAIYNKAMTLRDLSGYSVGELVNISANDSMRLFEAGSFAPFIYISAVTGIAVMVIR